MTKVTKDNLPEISEVFYHQLKSCKNAVVMDLISRKASATTCDIIWTNNKLCFFGERGVVCLFAPDNTYIKEIDGTVRIANTECNRLFVFKRN